MSIATEVNCLRAKVREYLISYADSGRISLEQAKQVAEFVAANIDTQKITNHDELNAVLGQLEDKFPGHTAQIDTIHVDCEAVEARKVIDSEVLELVAQGKLDEALDTLSKT